MLVKILITLTVLLVLSQLGSIFHVLPLVAGSLFRPLSAMSLENNVRVARERNVTALILLVPAILIIGRWKVWNPAFLEGFSQNAALGILAAVAVGWIILRRLIALWLRPRRRPDVYRCAVNGALSFFILGMLLALAGIGLMVLFKANDNVVRYFLIITAGAFYLLYLLHKVQILSLSCSALRTFLYLCTLEFLPLAILLVPAMVL